MLLTCQKDKFTLDSNIHYLNGAYMSPLLKTVEQAGIDGILEKRNPYEITIDDFFDPLQVLRDKFAQLIKAPKSEQIAIIPSVSYGMANAAANIPLEADDEIIMIQEQFPSNYYIWSRAAKESGAKILIVKGTSGRELNQNILSRINTRTKVVTLPIAHWADGTLLDIETISQKTKTYGGYVIIDGTQSIGALDFDLNTTPVDALIVAAYKWLLGPYSIGVAYYSERFDHGKPIEESWMAKVDSHKFSNLAQYNNAFQPGAKRYDVGETSNFILVKMCIAGLEQLLAWGPKNIQAYCKNLTLDAVNALRESGYLIESSEYRANHLFGIRLGPHMEMSKIKENLLKSKVIVSYRGEAIRVSPNIYNTHTDISALTQSLSKIY